jgi:hypothetical protein
MMSNPKKGNPMELATVDEFDTEQSPTKEAFIVDDLNKATWAMRKLRSVVTVLEANAEIAIAEKARIDLWLMEANKSLLQEREFFENHLTAYLRKEREKDPDTKSITTPYGKITSRVTQPKWETEEQLTDWLLNHNDTLIRIKYEVDKAELKKSYEVDGTKVVDPKTGEVVPFIQITPSDISYKVEVQI